jgi:hypothetical protein
MIKYVMDTFTFFHRVNIWMQSLKGQTRGDSGTQSRWVLFFKTAGLPGIWTPGQLLGSPGFIIYPSPCKGRKMEGKPVT